MMNKRSELVPRFSLAPGWLARALPRLVLPCPARRSGRGGSRRFPTPSSRRPETIQHGTGMLSRQVGGDGVGGVAVQAVAGVVVAAGRAGIFVAGVVLHVAQGGAGVQGEGDRRVAQ